MSVFEWLSNSEKVEMSHDSSVADDEPELFLKSEPLPAAWSLAEFQLHQAALEWSLADPIIIASEADIKSKPNWQDRLKPFEHQIRNLITFCRRLPVTLLADDVGLGKTISAGLILNELMIRNRVRRALVVCPSILGSQWVEELEAKFRIFARFERVAQKPPSPWDKPEGREVHNVGRGEDNTAKLLGGFWWERS